MILLMSHGYISFYDPVKTFGKSEFQSLKAIDRITFIKHHSKYEKKFIVIKDEFCDLYEMYEIRILLRE